MTVIIGLGIQVTSGNIASEGQPGPGLCQWLTRRARAGRPQPERCPSPSHHCSSSHGWCSPTQAGASSWTQTQGNEETKNNMVIMIGTGIDTTTTWMETIFISHNIGGSTTTLNKMDGNTALPQPPTTDQHVGWAFVRLLIVQC
jgi:hypothetical protein